MSTLDDEEQRLRTVAIQNAQSILIARQRAERELLEAKDALERKTAELAHSLSMMGATLESTTDAILVTDDAGAVTGLNENYVQMWRVPRAVVETRDHGRFLDVISRQLPSPHEFLDRVHDIYAAAPAESSDTLELSDGRVIERFSRIQFLDGRSVGRVWSFRDITERRRVEEALRDETRLLELLNRTGTRLAAHLDLQSLVQTVTDAATELTGARFGAFFYNAPEERGDGFTLFALTGAPREAFEKLGQPRATSLFGPTFRGEPPIRCADVTKDPRYGRMGPHHGMPPGHLPVRSYLAVPVVSRSDDVLGGLFFGHPEPDVFTDRSERIVLGVAAQAAVAIDNARLYEASVRAGEERRRLLESERSARAELERTNDLKDEFLATLSHELRTPLSAILGWSMILRHSSLDETELRRGLDTIERNARVQTQLIEDLLDMSRITSGKLRLDIQPVQPLLFIDAAIETVRPAAEAKNIRLEKLLDPGAGPISGDPNRLQQVVWNLVSNAIKFTARDGKVQIVLGRVDSHIEIRVADTGIGIRPEFLPHVFDRFRQADASSTRMHGGLGLGLAIVKNLVELHGGTVAVASPGEGGGTTFVVRLPLAVLHRPGDEEHHHPRTAAPLPGDFRLADLSGVRVLVVDDEFDARELLRRVLADCGAEVLTAANAHEALQRVEQDRPNLLVSDIGMPEVSGYELLRQVRLLGASRGGRIPAIALTAFARSEDRTRALRAGFLVHVAKPVDPSELVATVASVAGRAGEHAAE